MYTTYGWPFEDANTNVCICNLKGLSPRNNLSAFLIYRFSIGLAVQISSVTVTSYSYVTGHTRVGGGPVILGYGKQLREHTIINLDLNENSALHC